MEDEINGELACCNFGGGILDVDARAKVVVVNAPIDVTQDRLRMRLGGSDARRAVDVTLVSVLMVWRYKLLEALARRVGTAVPVLVIRRDELLKIAAGRISATMPMLMVCRNLFLKVPTRGICAFHTIRWNAVLGRFGYL